MIKAIYPFTMGLFAFVLLGFCIMFAGNSVASGYGNTENKLECMACHIGEDLDKKEVILKSGLLPKVKILYFISKKINYNKQLTKGMNTGRLLWVTNTFKVPWKTKQQLV